MSRDDSTREWIWMGRLHILAMTVLAAVFVSVIAVAQTDKSGAEAHNKMMPSKPDQVKRAIALIYPVGSSEVKGTVTFTQENNGVRVSAQLSGLTAGKYGFHIHEYGDCSSDDAKSAGNHFNPSGDPHGAPADAKRHEGDLGNIEVTESGIGEADFVDLRLSLSGPNSIIGRGVVVHQNPDDLKTQPSGNAGPRIGCGVIGIAMPDSLGAAIGGKTK